MFIRNLFSIGSYFELINIYRILDVCYGLLRICQCYKMKYYNKYLYYNISFYENDYKIIKMCCY